MRRKVCPYAETVLYCIAECPAEQCDQLDRHLFDCEEGRQDEINELESRVEELEEEYEQLDNTNTRTACKSLKS